MKKFPSCVMCVVLLILGACDTKTKVVDACGDGLIDPDEQCDGAALQVQNCQQLGYYQQNGELRCNADCTLDTSACSLNCGDGLISQSFGEDCEGDNLDGQTCLSQGLGAGTLSCDGYCRFDISGCETQAVCGDGAIASPYEQCEGDDLAGQSCETLGYYDGTLECDADCRFDVSNCEAYGECGDGRLQAQYGETCDGGELDGQSCLTLGYYGGTLTCGPDCRFRTTSCETAGRCGDDTVQAGPGETCDGADLDGRTCRDFGFHEGTLACETDCRGFVTTGCEAGGSCGDDLLQESFEDCDGNLLDGQSCLTLGYYGGELACDADCGFELSDCAAVGRCGDGALQDGFGEACDGADFGGQTCQDFGFYQGSLTCAADCTRSLAGCSQRCGDGTRQAAHGETCDGTDLGAQTCLTRGFYGGTLACHADCLTFDETACAAVGRCGDGLRQAAFGETCDGTDLGAQTCLTRGFYGGTLACHANCQAFDETACVSAGRCGDATVQAGYGEDCDGVNLNGQTCLSIGYDGGALACNGACDFDTSSCITYCNDGTLQTGLGEVCDGANLNGATCVSRGYYGGTLTCGPTCKAFNEAACAAVGRCGDDTRQAAFGETCDGADLSSQTCVSRGFYGGTLACAADCHAFVETGCAAVGRCGDATVQAGFGEVCDGANLDAQTCVSRGFYGGALACNSNCQAFDETACAAVGRCGDATVHTSYGEVCDGANLATQTCLTRGFYGGTLACNSNCQDFDETACAIVGRCGDGIVQSGFGEECDGANLDAQTCQTQDFYTGILACAANCRFELSGCAERCGDAIVQVAHEECDGANLDAESCVTLGYYGGALACTAGCDFDLASCEAAGWCGDHVRQGAYEDCEDADLGGASCRSLGHFTGTLACSALCDFNEASCRDATLVEVGGVHACVLLGNGTVRCWGGNMNGLLGDGTMTDRYTPVAVSGLTGVVALSASETHSCAVLTNGTMRCWGYNAYGQLGDGTTTNRLTPYPVSGITGAIGVETAHSYTCVLLGDGTARCWGYNAGGQLGDGTTTNRSSPVTVSGLSGAIALTSGNNHVCALLTGGTVKCWGDNFEGSLGDGSNNPSPVPVSVTGLSGVGAISAGGGHTCARLTSGEVKCWGFNGNGQLGDGTTTSRWTPVSVGGVTNSTAVAAASGHTCATVSGGAVKCWGYNAHGELGDGTTVQNTVPVDVTGLTGVASLSAERFMTCARRTSGEILCWGDNDTGQVGVGYPKRELSPVAVTATHQSLSVSTGDYHTCSAENDGTVECWGSGGSGQLGDGSYAYSTYLPVYAGGVIDATQVAAGYAHTCALLSDHSVQCWGLNYLGQLGDGTGIGSTVPIAVSGLTTAQSLTVGIAHTCARLSTGTVACWGQNTNGQLGDGTTTDQFYPVFVSGLSNVTAVHAGESHTCARLSDGSARCWGLNANGQLGDGTTTNRLTPVTVNLAGIAGIVGGDSFSCAWLSDATARCWGYNYNGRLGDGTTTNRLAPVVVVGLTGVTQLESGGGHTCALLADGTARCWGTNEFGTLGDGTTTARTSPIIVPGLSGVSELSVGLSHTCARLGTGALTCWGLNAHGQVGVNHYPYLTTPTSVVP